jgi:hypothetical protein
MISAGLSTDNTETSDPHDDILAHSGHVCRHLEKETSRTLPSLNSRWENMQANKNNATVAVGQALVEGVLTACELNIFMQQTRLP